MRIQEKNMGLLLLLMGCISFLYPQTRSDVLKTSLQDRLLKIPSLYPIPLPDVYIDPNQSSNATYKPDSIILGNVQEVFQTYDDTLSLIYHEYIHHQLYQVQKFPLAVDEQGNIVQWMTDLIYPYTPFPEEVHAYLRDFEQKVLPGYPNYAEMSQEDKARILGEMKDTFSQIQNSPFKYAPSNLAREEIFAYKQQLKGEKLGLYVLSESARENLQLRIKQFNITYKQRRDYEKKHKLLRSGEKKNNN